MFYAKVFSDIILFTCFVQFISFYFPYTGNVSPDFFQSLLPLDL